MLDAIPDRCLPGSATVPRMSASAATGPRDVDAARDGAEWVRALADDGPSGQAAQQDLRRILVAGLRRVVAARGVSEEWCEDFAQEALLRIRAHLAAFRGESQFTTWALSIAIRVAFDELRHKHWKDISFETVTADARGPITFEPRTDATQEKLLVRKRLLSELGDAIDKLSDKQRAVLIAELNGMPHAEIALALGMNRNALYKLAHDARKRIKAHLAEAGISEVDVMWVFE